MVDITTGEQSVSAVGAITGSMALDTSGYASTDPWCLKVRVSNLTSGAKMEITLEDSVDAFSNTVPQATFQVVGGGTGDQQTFSFQKSRTPLLRMGTSSGVLRAYVWSLTAGATAKVYAWCEK